MLRDNADSRFHPLHEANWQSNKCVVSVVPAVVIMELTHVVPFTAMILSTQVCFLEYRICLFPARMVRGCCI